VNQQSEHLSNAQIEEYGIGASGAGPDGEEEVAVEKHLADCPSCRNRVLEFQRRHLGLITPRTAPLSPAGAEFASKGTEERNLKTPELAGPAESPDGGNATLRLAPKVNLTVTTGCPGEEDLRDLAAGLCPETIAGKLVQHAAGCDRCGPLLQAYSEDFSGELTEEQQSELRRLHSALPAWQQQTAREMLRIATRRANDPAPGHAENYGVGGKVPPQSESGFLFFRWALITGSVTVFAMLTFAVFSSMRSTPEKAEKLLAQAAAEQRPTESRWPGAAYKAYSVPRGNAAPPRPLPLMQAESMLESHSPENANDAGWIRALAEKEIAVGNPSRAIEILEQTKQAGPASVPFLLDLAMAYFAQAEKSRDQASYEKSRQALDKVLQQQPGNPVALFNHALVYERLHAFDKAEMEWDKFLKVETDADWLKEGQKRLQELKAAH
jgi:tetratricopeptide (TPR) repeat protein